MKKLVIRIATIAAAFLLGVVILLALESLRKVTERREQERLPRKGESLS